MKCAPLNLGLDVSGMEILYPGTARNNNPTIIPHYSNLGYNLFRVLFRWERLQPTLVNYLQGTPSTTATFDTNYLNLLLQYVKKCTDNKSYVILQLDNGGWFDVSYDSTFVNDGTKDCPASNYVYIGQTTTTTVDTKTYIGPSVSQFSVMWNTLANTTDLDGNLLLNNPYVRFGLGQKTSIDDTSWIEINNSTISFLRNNNVNNVIYVDPKNSDYNNLSSYSKITDTVQQTVINVDVSTSITDAYSYRMIASNIASVARSNSISKVSIGDTRFDSTSMSLTSMTNLITYCSNNIDVFESLCLFAIGDSSNITTDLDLNYSTNQTTSVVTDKAQITNAITAKNSGSKVDTNIPPKVVGTIGFVQDSPIGTGNYSLETGSLVLPSIFSDSSNVFTVEFFAKRLTGDTSSGYIFGNSNSLSFYFDDAVTTVVGIESLIKFYYNTSLIDSKWHHYEFDFDSVSNSAALYIDGILIGKSQSVSVLDQEMSSAIGVRADGNTASTLNAYISNIAIWNSYRHTSNFTVPTTYYSGSEENLILYSSLNNSTDVIVN